MLIVSEASRGGTLKLLVRDQLLTTKYVSTPVLHPHRLGGHIYLVLFRFLVEYLFIITALLISYTSHALLSEVRSLPTPTRIHRLAAQSPIT